MSYYNDEEYFDEENVCEEHVPDLGHLPEHLINFEDDNDYDVEHENKNVSDQIREVYHFKEDIYKMDNKSLFKLRNGFYVSKNGKYPVSSKEVNYLTEHKSYPGYISGVSVVNREDCVQNKVVHLKIHCHLLIESQVAEFVYEISSQLSYDSSLAGLLVKMGCPVFIEKNEINLDFLIGKPINAKLVRCYGMNKYRIDEIESRAV